jgi:hypothetical protein
MTEGSQILAATRVAQTRAVPTDRLGAEAFRLGVASCAVAVAAFLLVQLQAWPPHEDETLALFIGRKSLGGLLHTVLGQRGGAPLHFLLAWVVAHTGSGLVELRLLSAGFAIASVPVMAALCARLVGREAALAATVLVSASWMLLFHGVYGRMYSLFLFTSALSALALLRAIERGGPRVWTFWGVATLLVIASHPYGALVLASEGAYAAITRERWREAAWAFASVGLLGIPFWRTDLILAGRFDVGVGGGGEKLGSPGSVLLYLRNVAGDFTAGWTPVVSIVLVAALLGLLALTRERPRSALFAACTIAVPAAAFLVARLGHSTSPQSRHLIFALPVFAALVAVGVLSVARSLPRRGATIAGVLALACLVPAEVAWGWHKTPELYTREAGARVSARHAAAAWLARTTRPDDVLLGYDPLFLEAWQRGGVVPRLVVPRADSRLAFEALRGAPKPLGRGVWIFDASDTNNAQRSLTIPLRLPDPPAAFEARRFGPFLIVRTREPTRTIRRYLKLARQAELLGEELEIGNAGVNLTTVLEADGRLAAYERGLAASRSSVSR